MKEKQEGEEKQMSMFPDIGDPTVGLEEPGEIKTSPPDDSEKIRAEAEELRKKLEEERRKAEEANERLLKIMSKQQEAPLYNPPQPHEEPPKLPDPIEDPEGYRAAIREESRRAAQEELQKSTVQQQARQKYDNVWADFRKQHSDLFEKHERLMTALIRQKLAEAKDKGIHPDVILLENSSQFINDVAAEARSMLGLGEANRTTVTGDVNLPATTGRKTEKHSNFIGEIKEAQRASGLF